MRLLPLLPAVLIASLLPSTAGAATLRAERSAARTCQDGLRAAGTAGVARTTRVVRGNGFTTVTLRGRGDWDLAVYDAATERLLDASATLGGSERVTVAPAAGRRIAIQACRRRGASRTARVATSFFAVEPGLGVREPVQQLRVALVGPSAFERLEATGLDVTHHHTADHADVVVYSAAEKARLVRLGMPFTVLDADMAASDRRHLLRTPAQQRRAAAGLAALPSGRTAYRAYADYGTDLKAILDDGAGFTRRVEIGRSLEDRPIEGIEFAADVNRNDDGRPVFLVLGVHHAREWPSGEMPMEFAVDLHKSFKAGDARVVDLLKKVRIIVVPIVNPDGFSVSRSVPYSPFDNTGFASLPLALTDGLSYKRKNCRALSEAAQATPCQSRPAGQGVDPNRNYGAYYGGVGSSTDPTAQGYRGTGPFSEPESEAVHKLSQTRNIVTLITHHTYTAGGTWLRQPGFCPFGAAGCSAEEDVVPDEAGMKALGDAMGQASGWDSQLGWAIGEITGATEDWNYFAASAYGYTPEQRGVNFHPAFEDAVIAEYTGEGAEGAAGGVREALLRAATQSADRTYHSVIQGAAKPGATLRLRKAFDTPTSIEGLVVKDTIDLTTVAGADGRYVWDVNPSTRPLSGVPEAYTMTCESGGTVLDTKAVTVARGQSVTVDLCGGSSVAPPVTTPPTTAGGGVPLRRFTFAVSRSKLTARIVNRRRVFNIGVRANFPVTKVVARMKRGKRTVARGTLARLTTRSKLRMRRSARLRRGTHTLEVRGVDASGRVVKATKRLAVR